MTPKDAVIIEDYDPLWPRRFEMLRASLASLLDGLPLAIEHVGSTAVPGLAAKPIIDVDVLLGAPGDLPRAILALASAGYQHRGDLGVPGREAFRTPGDRHPHHLYVCSSHRPYGHHVLFRDYLRAHPEEANVYATLKRKLALKFAADRDAYTNAKSEFIERILRAAESEKALSNLDVPSMPEDP